MKVSGFKIAPLALSVAMFATSFTPSEAFVAMRPPQIAQPAQDVDVVQYRSRDGDDWRRRHGFYRRGNEAYYNGTVVTTNAGAVIAITTECGFRWPRLPPARLLAERSPSARSVTVAAMWNGAQTGTAVTGLTTTPISRPTAPGANATLPLKWESYRKTVDRPEADFGREAGEPAGRSFAGLEMGSVLFIREGVGPYARHSHSGARVHQR